ncbi:MAG: Arc family DNA-binding protein [Acidobacteria bacterium]|nr:Arc family DNA-binding protein [Acidobacteriota bacterium]
MPVNLSIKNVPDRMADALRRRAERQRRSLQGELMVILEDALSRAGETVTVEDIVRQGMRSGLRTAADSIRIVRRARDSRHGR